MKKKCLCGTGSLVFSVTLVRYVVVCACITCGKTVRSRPLEARDLNLLDK